LAANPKGNTPLKREMGVDGLIILKLVLKYGVRMWT
jgi:hypothetical protein